MLVYDKEEPVTENLITWVFDENSFVPAAKLVGDKSYSILTDHLGTPYEAYDEEGQKVWSAEYDLYGNIHTLEGEKGFIPFRYQGQYEDIETGLYYNRFRYYSPESGTYISQDPIRIASGEYNFYTYVKDINSSLDLFGLKGGDMSFIGDALHPDSITPNNVGGYFEIQATGSYKGDRIALYEKSGIKDIWGTDYRSHHVSYDPETNKMIMQIVHNDYHKIDHTGGAKQFKEDTGFKYDTPEAIAEAERRNKLINENKH